MNTNEELERKLEKTQAQYVTASRDLDILNNQIAPLEGKREKVRAEIVHLLSRLDKLRSILEK